MASVEEALTVAADWHAAGRLDDAEALYGRILDAVPGQPAALHHLGILHAQTGRFQSAETALLQALKHMPNSAATVSALAAVRLMLGRREAALDALCRALALEPADAEAHQRMAAALGTDKESHSLGSLERAHVLAPSAESAGRLQRRLQAHGHSLVLAGRGAEAIAPLRRAATLACPDAELMFQLGNARVAGGQPDAALRAYRTAVVLACDHGGAWRNTMVIGLRLAEIPLAVTAARRAAIVNPDGGDGYDGLALARFRAADLGGALDAAHEALRQKGADRAAAPAPPLPARRAGLRRFNVVAFSLWGSNPLYLEGAVANARAVPSLYPGWRCRIYHDDSVPAPTLAALRAVDAELIAMPPGSGPVQGLYWRFSASDDPEIDRFLCRDADSRVGPREAAAVRAWIDSGLPFHVMRDHPLHTEVMLAGMWGGVAGLLPPLAALIEAHAAAGGNRWRDQMFLRHQIWPLIRGHCLVHDSAQPDFGEPFPPSSADPLSPHVGTRVV